MSVKAWGFKVRVNWWILIDVVEGKELIEAVIVVWILDATSLWQIRILKQFLKCFMMEVLAFLHCKHAWSGLGSR
jgi:hypothetical protein